MVPKRVVVVGAGVGGLTAAALLAQAGVEVTVLEAHVDPGGCAATFTYQGYRFDAGATLVSGFQPGGAHAIIGDRLGITWPVRRTEPAMQVHLPDHVVTRWGDADCWVAERQRVFPGTERFWRAQECLADRLWAFAAHAPPWPPQSISDVVRLLAAMRPGLVSLTPGLVGNVAAWAYRLGNADRTFHTFLDAQLLIAAQIVAKHAAPLYGAVALDLARAGVYHVQGGVGAIAETLVQVIRAAGGRVLFKRQVTQIKQQPGPSWLVHALRGPRHATTPEAYPADLVLANITPWDLQTLMTIDDGRRTNIYRQSPIINHQSFPQWGAFTVYVSLAGEAVAANLPDHHQIIVDDTQPLGEGNSVFMSLSPVWDASRAPAGQRVMTLSTHTVAAPWWTLWKKDRSAYLARREDYTERLLNAAERVLPGVRPHLRLVLPGTPLTFNFYTGRRLGMVGGFPQTSLWRAIGPRTAWPNVFLVGDSVFPGQSTAGVSLGALRVVKSILGR